MCYLKLGAILQQVLKKDVMWNTCWLDCCYKANAICWNYGTNEALQKNK